MNFLNSLFGTTTDASGNNGIAVNVNVTIAQDSLVKLFVVGAALIVVTVVGVILISLLKK